MWEDKEDYYGEDYPDTAIQIKETSNCAIADIDGLSCYRDPEKAMEDFCKLSFSPKPKYCGTESENDNQQLFSFYLFSAAVHNKRRPTYGTRFAKFIEENELGTVWASSIERNLAFHKDHSNQVWIWHPDTKAVKAWWNKRRKK